MSLVSTHKQMKIMESRDILRQYKQHTVFFNEHTVFVFLFFVVLTKFIIFGYNFFSQNSTLL